MDVPLDDREHREDDKPENKDPLDLDEQVLLTTSSSCLDVSRSLFSDIKVRELKCDSFSPSSTYAEQGKNRSVLFSVLYMIRGPSFFQPSKTKGKKNERESEVYIMILIYLKYF